jgi:hypothetical protein
MRVMVDREERVRKKGLDYVRGLFVLVVGISVTSRAETGLVT